MSAEEKKTVIRIRKPAARHKDVILGCLFERLNVLIETAREDEMTSLNRLLDLLDELGRSLRKDNGENE